MVEQSGSIYTAQVYNPSTIKSSILSLQTIYLLATTWQEQQLTVRLVQEKGRGKSAGAVTECGEW